MSKSSGFCSVFFKIEFFIDNLEIVVLDLQPVTGNSTEIFSMLLKYR